MKKITYLLLLVFLFACGGSDDQVSTTQDTSVNLVDDSTTSTIQDTTTTITETTTNIDTTTTTILKNKCEDCEYVNINELMLNIDIVPKYAWNDYQRISKENNIFENDSFEIILNIGPSTDL